MIKQTYNNTKGKQWNCLHMTINNISVLKTSPDKIYNEQQQKYKYK